MLEKSLAYKDKTQCTDALIFVELVIKKRWNPTICKQNKTK